MSDLRVVPFKQEGWREAIKTLREIADGLESGELPPCSVGVMAMLSTDGEVNIFGFGPKAEEMQSLALFRLGEQQLIDTLLCPGEPE